MNIAVWHNLPSGGGMRAMHGHVRGLVRLGHRVEIWCPDTADRDFLPLGDVAVEHVLPLDFAADRRGLARPLARLGRLRTMRRHARQCAAEIDAGGFDVLLANPDEFFAVPAVGRYAKTPAVLYLQEPNRLLYEANPAPLWAAPPAEPNRWRSPAGLTRLARDAVFVQMARTIVREEVENAGFYREILVNSHFSREGVLRAYGLNSRVCYLGIDAEHFADRHLPRERFVIGLGALALNKNLALVIRAVGRIPADNRPPLVWVGNTPRPGYLREMTALAAAEGVDFRPKVRIPEAELLDLLNRAGVMAYAPRLEPFGFAPLEAGACGCPVVAVAEGGVRETILDGETGLLVEHDPAAMAAGLLRVLDDPALATRLGRRAAEVVRDRWTEPAGVARLEARLLAAAGT